MILAGKAPKLSRQLECARIASKQCRPRKRFKNELLLSSPLRKFMQTIRQIYDDAPEAIPVPEAFRHRRLEVLLIVEHAENFSPRDLKSLLADMPDVGDDADFSRQRDVGRPEVLWDFCS